MGPQGVMRIGGALEQGLEELRVEDILGFGEVPRDLLLDRPAFLDPGVLTVGDAAHANRLDPQDQSQVPGRYRIRILGHALLGVRIGPAAQHRVEVGKLITAEAGAATKHHVLLGVGHARKTIRRLIRAREVVDLHGDHRRQVVADNDYTQPVVECRTQHVRVRCRGARLHRGHMARVAASMTAKACSDRGRTANRRRPGLDTAIIVRRSA